MPSNLIEPTGMAPVSGDETLSPHRGLRHDHGERVADRPDGPVGPLLVGYDGGPEAAAPVLRAAACAEGDELVLVHCWRSPANPRDTAVGLESGVHPHVVARVLEVVREQDAAARTAAERQLATAVALAQEARAQASGICARLRGDRPVADALHARAREIGAGGVVVGVRPRRGWFRPRWRRQTARVLARRLRVPVVAVPLVSGREES